MVLHLGLMVPYSLASQLQWVTIRLGILHMTPANTSRSLLIHKGQSYMHMEGLPGGRGRLYPSPQCAWQYIACGIFLTQLKEPVPSIPPAFFT